MPPQAKWRQFWTSLGLDTPLEFNLGDVGAEQPRYI